MRGRECRASSRRPHLRRRVLEVRGRAAVRSSSKRSRSAIAELLPEAVHDPGEAGAGRGRRGADSSPELVGAEVGGVVHGEEGAVIGREVRRAPGAGRRARCRSTGRCGRRREPRRRSDDRSAASPDDAGAPRSRSPTAAMGGRDPGPATSGSLRQATSHAAWTASSASSRSPHAAKATRAMSA